MFFCRRLFCCGAQLHYFSTIKKVEAFMKDRGAASVSTRTMKKKAKKVTKRKTVKKTVKKTKKTAKRRR
jgi:hypothetical protein